MNDMSDIQGNEDGMEVQSFGQQQISQQFQQFVKRPGTSLQQVETRLRQHQSNVPLHNFLLRIFMKHYPSLSTEAILHILSRIRTMDPIEHLEYFIEICMNRPSLSSSQILHLVHSIPDPEDQSYVLREILTRGKEEGHQALSVSKVRQLISQVYRTQEQRQNMAVQIIKSRPDLGWSLQFHQIISLIPNPDKRKQAILQRFKKRQDLTPAEIIQTLQCIATSDDRDEILSKLIRQSRHLSHQHKRELVSKIINPNIRRQVSTIIDLI